MASARCSSAKSRAYARSWAADSTTSGCVWPTTRPPNSETKLKVALKVIGWLVGIVTIVLGTVVGGLFVFARYLLPKLAAVQDAASAIT